MATRKTSDGRYVLKTGEYERKGKQKGFMFKWRDAYGVQCSVSALTLAELREKEKEVKIGKLEGKVASQQRKTVNDFYNIWYNAKRRTKIKPNVLSNYVYMYDRFVAKSFIGRKEIKNLKKSDVVRFYGDLIEKKGLAVSTVDNGVHTVLHQVIQVAVDDDVIRKNPTDEALKDIKLNNEKKGPKALTVEEQERFMEVIKDTVWEPIFGTMLYTGMRVAEVTALKPEDIDYDNGVIRVKRNFVYYRDQITGKVKGDKLMERRIQSTKSTAGDRRLPLNDKLYDLLELQKKIGTKNTDVVQSADGPVSGFLFATRFGQCHHQGSLNKALKRIVKEANSEPNTVLLPNIHCHMLRKTYCTNLCRAGVPLAVAKKLMGHNDIRVTSEIYTEIQDDLAKSADEQLQAYLDSERCEKIVNKSAKTES